MKVNGSALLIRADENTRIGTGHLMRCLALAQAWKDSGGEVAFITACESVGLLQRLSDEGVEAIQLDSPYPDPSDWEATSQALAAHPNAWVVLDGYHFDPAYQIRIKEAGHPLLVVDDLAQLEHYYADIVLNQNLHAEQLHYHCEPYTQLLFGTQYVLLRREFFKWQDWKREIPEVARKVLVSLGGGDPDNVTLKVIRAIDKLESEDLEAKVVIGPSNPHMASLKEAVHRSPFDVRLVTSVGSMPDLMAWADVAISAGGSTCWELAFMQVPALIGVTADNQRGVVNSLGNGGICCSLGLWSQVNEQQLAAELASLVQDVLRRTEMITHGCQLVDGRGIERSLAFMMALRAGKHNE